MANLKKAISDTLDAQNRLKKAKIRKNTKLSSPEETGQYEYSPLRGYKEQMAQEAAVDVDTKSAKKALKVDDWDEAVELVRKRHSKR